MMRAVSWNVWWRFGDIWRERQAGILETLQTLQADVIGLQESWSAPEAEQVAWLGSELNMHHAFVHPSLPQVEPGDPDQIDVALGLGLLSRWPIAEVRSESLPSARRMPPKTLVAQIDHPDKAFTAIVTCLEWMQEHGADRRAQADRLVEIVREIEGPVVLMGDLNAAPDSPYLATLTGELVDTWGKAGGGPGVTLSSSVPFAPTDCPEQIDERIDYILVRAARGGDIFVDGASVVTDSIGPLYPSDHFPVVADLRL